MEYILSFVNHVMRELARDVVVYSLFFYVLAWIYCYNELKIITQFSFGNNLIGKPVDFVIKRGLTIYEYVKYIFLIIIIVLFTLSLYTVPLLIIYSGYYVHIWSQLQGFILLYSIVFALSIITGVPWKLLKKLWVNFYTQISFSPSIEYGIANDYLHEHYLGFLRLFPIKY